MMILLTPDQAEHVRGITSPGSALSPVALVDGTYVLPIDVLDDPAHATKKEYLAALPRRFEPDVSEFVGYTKKGQQ